MTTQPLSQGMIMTKSGPTWGEVARQYHFIEYIKVKQWRWRGTACLCYCDQALIFPISFRWLSPFSSDCSEWCCEAVRAFKKNQALSISVPYWTNFDKLIWSNHVKFQGSERKQYKLDNELTDCKLKHEISHLNGENCQCSTAKGLASSTLTLTS
jgi:hypothetical protein